MTSVNLSVIPEGFDECVEGADQAEDIKSKSNDYFNGRSTFIARRVSQNVAVKQFGEKSQALKGG